MASYRLNRMAFKGQTAEQASASHAEYYKQLSWQERCRIANYLNSIAFDFPENNPPELDRTRFRARARNDGNIFNEDFRDFIEALNDENVQYNL